MQTWPPPAAVYDIGVERSAVPDEEPGLAGLE